jgi:hypothetical protein
MRCSELRNDSLYVEIESEFIEKASRFVNVGAQQMQIHLCVYVKPLRHGAACDICFSTHIIVVGDL